MGCKLTDAYKTCEDYALEKTKKAGVSKKAVAWPQIKEKRLHKY